MVGRSSFLTIATPAGDFEAVFGDRDFAQASQDATRPASRLAERIFLELLRSAEQSAVQLASFLAREALRCPGLSGRSLEKALEVAISRGEIRFIQSAPQRLRTRQVTIPFKEYVPQALVPEQDRDTSWIEIELVDKLGKPVPGEKYQVTLPDGMIREGTLDDSGRARLNRIPEGTCQVQFPQLDGRSWNAA